MPTPFVFMGMPSGDGHPHMGAMQAFAELATRRSVAVCRKMEKGSVLTSIFNKLWASALMNIPKGVTHFVMLHADVQPSPWWLDTLMSVMEQQKCDLVSVVMPIKNNKGLTSVGTGHASDPWDYRRLTMTEVLNLPETFGLQDIPAELTKGRDVLLVNTGCWLADLRRPWWRELDSEGNLRFCFTIRDRIRPTPSGELAVEFAPEDWNFSRLCHEVGAKVLATRRVGAIHWGEQGWPNDAAFGDLKTDSESDDYFSLMKGERHDQGACEPAPLH
jgi:hypothetical protein